MSKQVFMVGAAVAVFSLVLSSQTSQAQSESFGFPGGCTTCESGGCGSVQSVAAQQRRLGQSQMSQRFKQTQAQNDKVYARNAAWPKPFACGTRQHYHNIWNPMFDAGWEDQCILTGATHFDREGELTKYGVQQIGGMMMNMPQSRRVIFIQETTDPAETEMRLAKVRKVIDTYYSQRGGRVEVSKRSPAMMSGVRAVDITEKALGASPAPMIPIAAGNASIDDTIGQ